jgi:cytochrome c553
MHTLHNIFQRALLLCIAGSAIAQDVDPQLGKRKAQQSCAACHGLNGIATLPTAPHLAGQPQAYLVEQVKQYRDGKRSHEMMTLIAKPLTDKEIVDTAAWYASMQIEVKP